MDITLQINGKDETYTLQKYAGLCDVAVLQKVGGSVILCTICIDYESENKEDFLPLSVQYIEKMYAVGKIPAGFIKREGKPSDSEILTSRLIDRSLRAIMPKDFPYTLQVTLMVLSYDNKSDLQQDALNLASISLFLSSVPIKNKKLLCASRILQLDSKIVATSDINDLKNSTLDLFVSGFDNKISMIEMQKLRTTKDSKDSIESKNTPDSKNPTKDSKTDSKKDSKTTESNPAIITKENLLKALKYAIKDIESKSKIYTKAFKKFAKPKHKITNCNKIDSNLLQTLSKKYTKSIKTALISLSKSERQTQMKALIESIANAENIDPQITATHIYALKKDIMREMILSKGKRADNRKLDSIRPINIESNILPHAHGSAVFTRGQTQVLVTCTLGSENEAQKGDSLSNVTKSNVMFHYNFPPFCVGEAFPILAQSRRELGHGNLALRAIESSIPKLPNTLRFVSEVLSSNGSSSMASVCGASLALKGAGVEMREMVAGIAIGLVFESDTRYAILSDIMGLEDFDGDMDFKIAGTRAGFSALQLDIKLDSISLKILGECLERGSSGISHILDIMEKVKIVPNVSILPKSESFAVPQGSLSDIIGQGGRVIKDIISRFNVSVNLDKDKHIVTLSGADFAGVKAAKEHIDSIVESSLRKKEKRENIESTFKIDSIYLGVVKKITDFGVFVEIAPEIEGLIRTEKLALLQSPLELDSKIQVKVINNTNGKLELTLE
ncbi:polyribonucleotide nucleotidyltransferase [Helicobacter saguini]|uniref:polyribonucleotide nucleotidyltransferase n=1 Tax=Helicobacter saguini TaxID=1548018 RepID=A0A4U8T041_9HELI|nr:polyribonucleotide nucleotidyltransferase [Helicobacter saguini]MWV61685.1 polyribonucleotide nucleotidyltransferase [Helicobacter saguini]MWV67642.1 polyribonucleotide nucleotidyltransferase [Helicobacter saguini]MWV69994.1 polyribonucleotide nucleotidyltransferase [Helicobacter saguini]MWV72792.1 polyribonucleotide nucleotidyltransferase [Helicobacter saguini]TLD92696.1 polyribonucleotide nucleotidyltransferase [Helicobacter saguini]